MPKIDVNKPHTTNEHEDKKPISLAEADRLRLLTARVMVSVLTIKVSDKVTQAFLKIETIKDETKAARKLKLIEKIAEGLFIANTIDKINHHEQVLEVLRSIEKADGNIDKILKSF